MKEISAEQYILLPKSNSLMDYKIIILQSIQATTVHFDSGFYLHVW